MSFLEINQLVYGENIKPLVGKVKTALLNFFFWLKVKKELSRAATNKTVLSLVSFSIMLMTV